MRKKRQKKDTELESATRAVYLIASSLVYALNELLLTKSQLTRKLLLKRMDEDAKYLNKNLSMLRSVVYLEK